MSAARFALIIMARLWTLLDAQSSYPSDDLCEGDSSKLWIPASESLSKALSRKEEEENSSKSHQDCPLRSASFQMDCKKSPFFVDLFLTYFISIIISIINIEDSPVARGLIENWINLIKHCKFSAFFLFLKLAFLSPFTCAVNLVHSHFDISLLRNFRITLRLQCAESTCQSNCLNCSSRISRERTF